MWQGVKTIFKKREYSMWQSFLIVFIITLLLLVMQTVIQNGADFKVYISQLCHPLAFIGNFVPLFAIVSVLFLLTGNVAWSTVPVGICLNVLLTINHYKVVFRDSPLKPSDLSLGREAANIVQNYPVEFCPRIFICTLIMVLCSLFVICCIRTTKRAFLPRLYVAIAVVIVYVLLHMFYITNAHIYKTSNKDAKGYFEVQECNYKGFIYTFVSNFSVSAYHYAPPEGYSDKKAQGILDQYNDEAINTDKMPNIIAIMSEAYFDIEQAKNASFYESPNPNFTALKKESQYGHIIVPGFAGDTASTEFEFLTGASLYLVNRQKPSPYNFCITKDAYGLPRVLKDAGYNTLAIHPGDPWFYNRDKAYKYLGFDRFISKDDLPKDTEFINNFVSDNETADLIIENYKNHLKNNPDKKYFNFTVTIQNHGPYSTYGTWRSPVYVRPDGMSEPLYNTINNYTIGHQDADALLGKVIDYLRSVDEPTVVVFFGDHLPQFDEERKAYEYLGYDITAENGDLESYQNRFSTPYLIWSNPSAKQLISQNGKAPFVGDKGYISSNFLPGMLFEYIGAGMPRYFAYTQYVMEKSEVIGSDYFVVNGKKLHEVPDEIYREYMDYRIVQYYNLKRYK